jgi:hypothetical protein
MTFSSRHMSVSIDRPAAEVYAFAASPEHLPQWAAGLSGSIQQVDGDWIAESPMGRVKVQLAPENPFGVLDHEVTLPSGERVLNPMRVVPNAAGSEVIFTVFQRAGMTDDMFEADTQAVARDLATLKSLLEAKSAG